MESRDVFLFVGLALLSLGAASYAHLGPFSVVSGSCPTGYYYVPSLVNTQTVELNGNYYSGCVSASWLESNATLLTSSQWVGIQAADYGLSPSQFIQEDANTYVYCSSGSPVDMGSGWGCSQPGKLSVISDATYIYSIGGEYIDLAPSQVQPVALGSVQCPGAVSTCPPETSITSRSSTTHRSSSTGQPSSASSSTTSSTAFTSSSESTTGSGQPPGNPLGSPYLTYSLLGLGIVSLLYGTVGRKADD